jgi:UDP-4-amino-4,6-dideoxy-N-acetyl-beta-L-altrosamine N-acetyltransferase
MVISLFGVKLIRLIENDIELVRKWRNSPDIGRYMSYKEYITPEMQKAWFSSVNNIYNHHYIIEYKKKKIGLISSKNVNWDERSSEGGMFIWDKKYIDSFVPLLASFCLLESGFAFLKWKTSYINVLRSNPAAINYALNLGYVLCYGQENVENQKYFLTKQSYLEKTVKLRDSLFKMFGPEPLLSFLFEPSDYEVGIAQLIEKDLIADSSVDIKLKNTVKGKYYYTRLKLAIR